VNKSIVFKAPINGFQYLQGDAFNYYKIISGQTVIIPENTEYLLTQDLELIGDIEIIGDLVCWDNDTAEVIAHLTDTANPHNVTAAQVGAPTAPITVDNTILRAHGTAGEYQDSGIIIDDNDLISHLVEGDQFVTAHDASPFRKGSWAITPSGEIYDLNSQPIMDYQSHNVALDANGDFLARDEDGEHCQLVLFLENGHIHYYHTTNTTGVPVWEQTWGVNIADSTTGSGPNTYTLLSQIVDGATAVGIDIKTENALTTDGAKVMTVSNDGLEQFFVGIDNGKNGVWANKIAIGSNAQIDEYSVFNIKETIDIPFSAPVLTAAVSIDVDLNMTGSIKRAAAFYGKGTVLAGGGVLPFVSGMMFEVDHQGTASWGSSNYVWQLTPAVITSRYTSQVGSITMGALVTNILAGRPDFLGGLPSDRYMSFAAAPMDLAYGLVRPIGLNIAPQHGSTEGIGIVVEQCSHTGIKLEGDGAGSDIKLGANDEVSIYHDGTDLALDGPVKTYAGVTRKVTTQTTATLTLDATHHVVLCDASSNAITITLPAAASHSGREYYIKATNTTSSVSIDTNGSETIDNNSSTRTLALYSTMKIVSDGTEWWII